MIRNGKQNWTIGSTLSDVYFLANVVGTKLYEFTPHKGLCSVTIEEAAERVAELRVALERIAMSEAARAGKVAQASARFNEIFA